VHGLSHAVTFFLVGKHRRDQELLKDGSLWKLTNPEARAYLAKPEVKPALCRP
jgi:hypothetical protein